MKNVLMKPNKQISIHSDMFNTMQVLDISTVISDTLEWTPIHNTVYSFPVRGPKHNWHQ